MVCWCLWDVTEDQLLLFPLPVWNWLAVFWPFKICFLFQQVLYWHHEVSKMMVWSVCSKWAVECPYSHGILSHNTQDDVRDPVVNRETGWCKGSCGKQRKDSIIIDKGRGSHWRKLCHVTRWQHHCGHLIQVLTIQIMSHILHKAYDVYQSPDILWRL